MRATPPLWSSVAPTIRTILARSVASQRSAASTSTQSVSPSDDSGQSEESVTVTGWIKSIRAHKNVSFAAVSDGSSRDTLQAVLKGAALPEQLHVGSSVKLTGRLARSRGAEQPVELRVDQTQVIGDCDPEKKHVPEHVLREQAHLRFKTTITSATMRVRDALMRDWHDWFEANEFVHIHTPILTSSDCEGAGEVFRLQNPTLPSTSTSSSTAPTPPTTFFPHPVNLTVSSQLHLEAPTHALSRAYTLSPSFRSENSTTSRHLAEFYMLEGEMVVESLDALLDVVEDGIRQSLHLLFQGHTERSKRARQDIVAIAIAQVPEGDRIPQAARDFGTREDLLAATQKPFKRITYTQAVDEINAAVEAGESMARARWGNGLSTEQEKFLAKSWGGPVFVTHYPAALKPFYMLPSDPQIPDTPAPTVACFDLLVPGLGELVGGSLREHRLDHLRAAIDAAGLKEEDYQWYLDLRRFGSMPHGGWGMGWDRYVSWVTHLPNIRDVVAFPRWVGHCKY